MPLPLKPGFNFNLDHQIRPAYYEMGASEAYTEFYGISYMISGERLIYSPGFTTIAHAGELVFIPKYVYRRTTYVSSSPYERIIIKFNDVMLRSLFDSIGREPFDQLCSEHVIRFAPEDLPVIDEIFAQMEQIWENYDNYSQVLLEGLLNKLIITCLKKRILLEGSALTPEKHHTYLVEAIGHIKANLRQDLSLETVAKAVNISPSYLSKIFINQLRTPFSTFVLNEKILLAQKLLAETNLSITEIALESGFSGSAYFSDCFKRNVGVSPLKFRKGIRG